MSPARLEPERIAVPRRRLRRLGRSVAVLAGLALAALVGLLSVLPLVTHATARSVLSGSMAPALPVGSVVFDRPVAATQLRVGDIATYRESLPGGSLVITHRIVAIDSSATPRMFTFRGDANRSADPVDVPAGRILGRVWFDVPYLGRLRSSVADARPALIVGGVLGLGAYSVWQLAGGIRERREGT